MKESRLFKIVYYLLDKEKTTASELAEKFEVSVRTIYRDIDSLSSAGIPVYTVQGKDGGISLLPEFVLNQSLLSKKEKEQILMAIQGISALDYENSDLLINKLGGLFKLKTTNWIEVDFTEWSQNSPKQIDFDLLKDAILDQNVVKFLYFGSSGFFTNRIVEPVKLIFKSMNWYLFGFCRSRNAYRYFKLTRIKNLEILPEHFIRDFNVIPKTNITLTETATISVKLKFSSKAAFRVYDEFKDQVVKDKQGNLIVETKLPNNEILYSYLLSFGNNVEVLEPKNIRDNMRDYISSLLEKYKT